MYVYIIANDRYLQFRHRLQLFKHYSSSNNNKNDFYWTSCGTFKRNYKLN